MKRMIGAVVLMLAVAGPAQAGEVSMGMTQFLTATVYERLGYAKGVMDAFGGGCTGKTWEQLLAGTDLLIQRGRMHGGDFVAHGGVPMPAGVYVLAAGRMLGCVYSPQESQDIDATADAFNRRLNQGR